ncbi:hypothetical protein ACQYAD_07120 [Neobacillus sp. SM06]|uniref:hypothetical protein n=1 Tax=Neobacillus sp. SM06 TaxID=3422492 RepID=UPI003D298656
MPKEKLKTKPLLFIRQPEFEVNHFQMQQSYRFKVDDQENTLKRYDEADFKEEILIEKQRPNNDVKQPQAAVSVEQKEERIVERPVVEQSFIEKENHQAIRDEILSGNNERNAGAQGNGEAATKSEISRMTEAVVQAEISEFSDADKDLAMVEENQVASAEETDVAECEVEEEHVFNQANEAVIDLDEGGEIFDEADGESEADHESDLGGMGDEMGSEESAAENLTSQTEQLDELRALITRLARYPNVIERPICEAVLNGKKVNLQVLSKRGDLVKVKVARTIKKIPITEFEQLSILPSWKGL